MTPHALCIRCQLHAFKKIEFLREFEFLFDKALIQGPRTDGLMEKTEGQKSRDTIPLNVL
jgi:hypothetical protein